MDSQFNPTDQHFDQLGEGEHAFEGEDQFFSDLFGEGEDNDVLGMGELDGEGEIDLLSGDSSNPFFSDTFGEGECGFNEGEDLDGFDTTPFQFHFDPMDEHHFQSQTRPNPPYETSEDNPISLLSSDDDSHDTHNSQMKFPSQPTIISDNRDKMAHRTNSFQHVLFDSSDFQNTSSVSDFSTMSLSSTPILPHSSQQSQHPFNISSISITQHTDANTTATSISPKSKSPSSHLSLEESTSDSVIKGNKRLFSQLEELSNDSEQSDHDLTEMSQHDANIDEAIHSTDLQMNNPSYTHHIHQFDSESEVDLATQSIKPFNIDSQNISLSSSFVPKSKTALLLAGLKAKNTPHSSLLQSTSKLNTHQQNKKQKLSRATIGGNQFHSFSNTIYGIEDELESFNDGEDDVDDESSIDHDHDHTSDTDDSALNSTQTMAKSSRGSILSSFGQALQHQQRKLQQDVFNSSFASTNTTPSKGFGSFAIPPIDSDSDIICLDDSDDDAPEQHLQQHLQQQQQPLHPSFLNDFDTMSQVTAKTSTNTADLTMNDTLNTFNTTTSAANMDITHKSIPPLMDCVDLLSSDEDGENTTSSIHSKQSPPLLTQLQTTANSLPSSSIALPSLSSHQHKILSPNGFTFDVDGFLLDKQDRLQAFIEIPEPTTHNALSLLQSPSPLLSARSAPSLLGNELNQDMSTTLDTHLNEVQKYNYIAQFQSQTTLTLANTFTDCQSIWQNKESNYLQQIYQLQEVIHAIKDDFVGVQQKYLHDVVKVRDETNIKQQQMYSFYKEVVQQCQNGLLDKIQNSSSISTFNTDPYASSQYQHSTPLITSLNSSITSIEQMYNDMGTYSTLEQQATERLNDTLLSIAQDVGILDSLGNVSAQESTDLDQISDTDGTSDDTSSDEDESTSDSSESDLVMIDSDNEIVTMVDSPIKIKKEKKNHQSTKKSKKSNKSINRASITSTMSTMSSQSTTPSISVLSLFESKLNPVATSSATLEIFSKLQDKLFQESTHVTRLSSQNDKLESQNSSLSDEISTLHTVLSAYQAQEELNYRQKMKNLGGEVHNQHSHTDFMSTSISTSNSNSQTTTTPVATTSFYTQLQYDIPLLPLQTYPRTYQDIYQLVVILQTQKNELLDQCKNTDLIAMKQKSLILQQQSKLQQYETMNITSQAVTNLLGRNNNYMDTIEGGTQKSNKMIEMKNLTSIEEIDHQLAHYESELSKSLENIVAIEKEQYSAQKLSTITPFDFSPTFNSSPSLFTITDDMYTSSYDQSGTDLSFQQFQNSQSSALGSNQLTAYEKLHQKIWADYPVPSPQTALLPIDDQHLTTSATSSSLSSQRQLLVVYRELLELRRLYTTQLQTHQLISSTQNARLQKIPLMEEQIRTLHIGIDSKQDQIRGLLRDNLGLKYYVNKLQQWVNSVGHLVVSTQFQSLLDEFHMKHQRTPSNMFMGNIDLNGEYDPEVTHNTTASSNHLPPATSYKDNMNPHQTPQKQLGSNFISDIVFSTTKANQQLPMTNTPSRMNKTAHKFTPTEDIQNDINFLLNNTSENILDDTAIIHDGIGEMTTITNKMRQSLQSGAQIRSNVTHHSITPLPHSTIKKTRQNNVPLTLTPNLTNIATQQQQQMTLSLHGRELTPFDISEQIKYLLTKYESVDVRYKLLHRDFIALQTENTTYLDKINDLEQKVASDEVLGHLDGSNKNGMNKINVGGVTVKKAINGSSTSLTISNTTTSLPIGFTSINERELQSIIRERNQFKTESLTLSIELNETKQFLTTCLNTTSSTHTGLGLTSDGFDNMDMGDDDVDPLDEVDDIIGANTTIAHSKISATPMKSTRQSLNTSLVFNEGSPLHQKQFQQLRNELTTCKDQLAIAEAAKVSYESQIAQYKSTMLGLVTTNQTQRDSLREIEKAFDLTKTELQNAQKQITTLEHTQREIVLSHSQLLKNIASDNKEKLLQDGSLNTDDDNNTTSLNNKLKTPNRRKSTRYSTVPTLDELNSLLTPRSSAFNTTSTLSSIIRTPRTARKLTNYSTSARKGSVTTTIQRIGEDGLDFNPLFNEFDSDNDVLNQDGLDTFNPTTNAEDMNMSMTSSTRSQKRNSTVTASRKKADDDDELYSDDDDYDDDDEADMIIDELERQIVQYQQQIGMLENELQSTKTNLLSQLSQQDVQFAELCSEIQRLQRYERQYTEDQERGGYLTKDKNDQAVITTISSSTSTTTSESTSTNNSMVDNTANLPLDVNQELSNNERVHILRFKLSPIELAHKQWCSDIKQKNEQHIFELTALRDDMASLVTYLNSSFNLTSSTTASTSMLDVDAVNSINIDTYNNTPLTQPTPQIIKCVQKYLNLQQNQSINALSADSTSLLSSHTDINVDNTEGMDMFDLARHQQQLTTANKVIANAAINPTSNSSSSETSTDTLSSSFSLIQSTLSNPQYATPIPLNLSPEQIIQLRAEVLAVRDINSQLYNENNSFKTTNSSLKTDLQISADEKAKLLVTFQELLHQKVLLERTVSNLTQEQREILSTIREMVFYTSGWIVNIEHRNVAVVATDVVGIKSSKSTATPLKPALSLSSSSFHTPSKSSSLAPSETTKVEIWFNFSIRLGKERFTININSNILPLLKQTGIERSFHENAAMIVANVTINNETVPTIVRRTELPGMSSQVFGKIRELIRDLLSNGKLTTFMTQLFFFFAKLKKKIQDSSTNSIPTSTASQMMLNTNIEPTPSPTITETSMNDDVSTPIETSISSSRHSIPPRTTAPTSSIARRTTASLTNHTPSKRK